MVDKLLYRHSNFNARQWSCTNMGDEPNESHRFMDRIREWTKSIYESKKIPQLNFHENFEHLIGINSNFLSF